MLFPTGEFFKEHWE